MQGRKKKQEMRRAGGKSWKNRKDHTRVAMERMTDRDGEKDRERWRHGETETMRRETKQVAWVIAWGI